jgi:vacuolar protein sorting-associated protein 13A/C
VTLYPRFVIKNDTEDDLRFREFGSKRTTTISAGQRHSIEFLSAGKEPQLLLAYSIGTSDWSAPFKLQDIGESYTRIRRVEADEALLQVNVMLAGPCIFIKLATHTGKWPYLLRNDSDYQMEVSQAVRSIFLWLNPFS